MITRALTGWQSADGTIFVSHTRILISRSSRRASEVFSAIDLVALVRIWRGLKSSFFDPYRPELHYMRGPGPKCREKRLKALTSDTSAR